MNNKLGSRILRLGSIGPDVKELQLILQSLGYDPGPIDGIYGYRTMNAVMRFQKDNGLVADGIVGPKTVNTIFQLYP
ncbi:MAG: peptidoglycan-binding domain-containing protein [Thermoanaerobacteraceae bacterium]|nr:peptidoglycan-binding domain-containing protein [Thermoanaerobacteraceae bacterium]